MSDTIFEIAATALNITPEEARRNHKPLSEINAYYVWNPSRGGRTMIINEAGERLIASSAVKFEDHLKTFLSGRRN